VIEREYINSEIVKIVKNSPVTPVITPLHGTKCSSYFKTTSILDDYFRQSQWPETLTTLKNLDKDLAFMSLGMAISFLSDALIDEQTIIPGQYKIYEPESNQ
jgi:hypothetical protein